MTAAIAIVGMACRYPDARSPSELWENVLAKRRAFRRMPANRLRLEDYFSADRTAPDRTYATEAAVIENYHFDRVRFRVAGSTYRSADLAHWLALDIASQALADAGFTDGVGLMRETTGVLLGNTLTGEFSRASVMRLRWPYVQRMVEATLAAHGVTANQRQAFLAQLEASYKEPFAPVGEETLAGGLANTIAGRICNYFDLHGGGYTVDGACASSLLAVTTACSSLVAGDLDVAIAGGIDLSLDPFELVGFAKTGALASDLMRIYDAGSNGFWPGEGCGMVVLMRHADAIAMGRRIYGVIRGWGVSSDGSGGITRPEVEGQLLAVRRSYKRAGFGIDTVAYFEGHGTGTQVGDSTELRMLSRARREAAADAPPAVIGSIKANIGHTKAAAGVAGLIKATLALHHQILPPTTGCEDPHVELTGDHPALQVLSTATPWPADRPLRASVSAMGFGGINTHIALESDAIVRRTTLSPWEQTLVSSTQDSELLLFSARDSSDLLQQMSRLLPLARQLARAELADLAVQLQTELNIGPVRAAIIATTPMDLVSQLETLQSWLNDGVTSRLDIGQGVFLGGSSGAPRIGFLFPGQGSPAHVDGGALRRRFAGVQELYGCAELPASDSVVATAVAQPAIVTASLAGLYVLNELGIQASLAVGHSLGELTALHWAGVFDEQTVIRFAATRGRIMTELGNPTGAMASVEADPHEVTALLDGSSIVIAGLNAPQQTVIAGDAREVAMLIGRVQARGKYAKQLPVSHAFHSPYVAAAMPVLADALAQIELRPLRHSVISTVTGQPLDAQTDLRALLTEQVTAPVRFVEAATAAAAHVDLLIEVGPGRVLSGLTENFVTPPVISINAGGSSLLGLWKAVGAAFVLGTPINHRALSAGRFTRRIDLDKTPTFFTNPCELAPTTDTLLEHADTPNILKASATASGFVNMVQAAAPPSPESPAPTNSSTVVSENESALEVFRRLVAERAELPTAMVRNESHLLSDLHLNSIAVSELVVRATRQLGLGQPLTPTDYADATIAEVGESLAELVRIGAGAPVVEDTQVPSGIASWINTFTIELVEQPRRSQRHSKSGQGVWQVLAPPAHPLADLLEHALADGGGKGVVVWLPPAPNEDHVQLLLNGAHLAIAGGAGTRFVLVQHGGGAASFARTLHIEHPKITTCVVDVPPDHPDTIDWIVAEALAANGYSETDYDAEGHRRVPVLRQTPATEPSAELALGPSDVLMVTGGGKGITAECALMLAHTTCVRLALLGRARPDEDAELQANIARMTAAGIHVRYVAVDITDADAVRAAVAEIEAELGPITGLLHGAARNVPQLITMLDQATITATLAPKVQGLRNVLEAINPEQLRLLVTFGSIIARTGLRGEADYALANEWLTRLTEEWQASHPACRCLAVEWSVWASVGMGVRDGYVDALMRGGIVPIPPDAGLAILQRLLNQRSAPTSVVVAGRFGAPPTLTVEQPNLPFLRFLEQPRVYYPGIELIVDVEVSASTDPYLDDHVFAGQRLFPAVLGLEAMAQTAMALAKRDDLPVFENVSFDRAVVVAADAPITLRIAALMREPGQVELVLRSKETAFQIDHFRATCRFDVSTNTAEPAEPHVTSGPAIELDAAHDLYGGLLFHRGRFQRLTGYEHLTARSCSARIADGDAADWFGRYLPPTLLLGDPGARDATIHAIQACVPHVALLPIGVERLVFGAAAAPGPWRVDARERSKDGDIFTYDVEVWTDAGQLRERWEGLRLRVVSGSDLRSAWVAPLLGPYVERQVQDLIEGAQVTVAVDYDPALSRHRQARSNLAIQRALGQPLSVQRRPDGKPEVNDLRQVSASHTGAVTLAVAGIGALSCDIETVVVRAAASWQELLDPERLALAGLIAQVANDDEATAATRVWSATECLKKAGVGIGAPLLLATTRADGWVLLRSDTLSIATFVTTVRGIDDPLVLAVLASDEATPLIGVVETLTSASLLAG